MIVCVCSASNEDSIRRLIKEKRILKIKDIQKYDVCNDCKKCSKEIKKLIHEQNLY